MAKKGSKPSNRHDFVESVYSTDAKVDRTAGVIRGVKILGRHSKNPRPHGREYSDAAMQQAAQLYEGITVNVNHPNRKDLEVERGMEEGFGILQAVAVKPDGVYGDLHYLKAHPLTEMILERTERFPTSFGLSQNGAGDSVFRDGKIIVESVGLVRSVDIVGKPATTNGLFESEESPVKKTFKEFLESLDTKRFPGRANLLEDMGDQPAGDGVYGDVPVEVDDSAEPDDQVEAALRSLIDGVLDDDSVDDKDKLSKIKDILGFKAKLAGKAAPSGDSGKGGATDATESLARIKTRDPALQQLLEEVGQLKQQQAAIVGERDALKAAGHARNLLESLGREPSEVRIKALVAMGNDSDRRALIETWPRGAGNGTAPRPARSAPLVESDDNAKYTPTDGKSFAAAVR